MAYFLISDNIKNILNIIHLLQSKHTISRRRNEMGRNPKRPGLNLNCITYAYNGSDLEEIISELQIAHQ